MGRNRTGICEVSEVQRIELSFILKQKLLVKGKVLDGSLYWNQGEKKLGSISIRTSYLDNNKFIKVKYTSTDNRTGNKTDYDYKIELVTVPSNLGKGEVLYMLCPSGNGTRCRILYNAYRSGKWYSRKFFEQRGCRLYYPSQAQGKNDYEYNRLRLFEKKYSKIWGKKNFHPYHKGNKTKALIKLEKIEQGLDYWTDKTNKQFERLIYSGVG